MEYLKHQFDSQNTRETLRWFCIFKANSSLGGLQKQAGSSSYEAVNTGLFACDGDRLHSGLK